MAKTHPNNKGFRLFDAVLASVCIVMTVEASSSAALMGNKQFFWWAFMAVAFFFPYGLISAELGTAYQGEGGIYEWVKHAFGMRTGSRTACYYWFNYPIWVSSIVLLFTTVLSDAFQIAFTKFTAMAVQLTVIWLVAFFSVLPLSESKWIFNLAAVFKAAIMAMLGGFGLYAAFLHGPANPFTLNSFLPSLDSQGLSYLSVILFDLMGFEVITTYTAEMEDPNRELPRAIKLGGLLIVGFYMLAAFGLSVAVPVEKLDSSTGVLNAFRFFLNGSFGFILILVALMFLYSLAANLISWSLGVNYVLKYAAQDGALPQFLSIESKSTGMPLGAILTNGLISSLIVMVEPLIPDQDLFWQFFALNMVILLLSYVMIFPAFLKLRKADPNRPRPFRVKGGRLRLTLLAFSPMILLLLSTIFTVIPLNLTQEEWIKKIPLLIGVAFTLVLSELIAAISVKRTRKMPTK